MPMQRVLSLTTVLVSLLGVSLSAGAPNKVPPAGVGTPHVGTAVRRVSSTRSTTRPRTPRAFTNDFTIDTTTTNLTDQMLGLCANHCYAGTTTFSTVPYYTLDSPRNLTLVYHEDRAHPRPIIVADVTPVSGSATPSYYTLAATLNGTPVQFLNGDYTTYFLGYSTGVRLAQQFDASSYTTGNYTLIVTVTANIAGTIHTHSYTRLLAIANEIHSPVAHGWTIAGVQRLYVSGSTYLITDGLGNAVPFLTASFTLVPTPDYSTLGYDSSNFTYTRQYMDGSQVVFNTLGEMIKAVDQLGLTTTFTYDTLGRLTKIVDPARNTLGDTTAPYIQLSYNATYGLSAIQEMGGPGGAGRKTGLTLGSDSTLQSITDPGGGQTSYTYDASKRLSHIINRHRDTTTYQYDAHSWKLTEVDLPRVPVDAGGGATTTAIPKIKEYPWMTYSVPTTATSVSALAGAYSPATISAIVTDPIGHSTTMTVDRWGQPLVIIDPLGRHTTITRLGILPVKLVYPSGGIDTIAYLSNSPLVSYLKTAGDSVVNYHYSTSDNQVDSVWGSGMQPEYRFLNATSGRVDSVRYSSSDSTIQRYTYDAYNRLLSMSDPEGHTTTFHYDPIFGNQDSVGGPGSVATMMRFDAFGRDTATRSTGSPVWIHTSYDTLNRVTKTWHLGIVNDTTIITYDSVFVTHIRAPGGRGYKIATNALGWMTARYSMPDPDTIHTSFRYDTAGRLTSFTNARGQRVDMTYDAIDRLLTRTISGTLADTFSYSTDGRIVRATRKNVSRDSLFLDIAGDPDSLVRGIAGYRYAFRYRYSALTNGAKQTDSIVNTASIPFSQETDIVHNTLSPVDTLTLTGAHEAGSSWILHLRDGDPYEIRWPDFGHDKLWFYTGRHQTAEMYPYYNNITTMADSLGRFFTYDSLGRVAADHRFYNGHTVPSRSFVYDSLGQLLKVMSTQDSTCSTTYDSLDFAYTYNCTHHVSSVTQDSAAYDQAGNRLFVGAVYDTLNHLTTGPPGVSYTYDADGNLVTRTHGGVTDSLFWSATGQLDSVASGGSAGLRHMYEYNSFGQLVRRQTKVGAGAYSVDRYFLWDINQLIAELAYPGTHRIAQYVYYGGTDQPFALITDSGGTSKVRYFYPDGIEGNLMGIMKDTITLHQYTQYTAWGQILARPINVLADTNRLGWKGLMYEGDSTRLYFVRNRWYDPAVGRFVSEDPSGIAAGVNLYAFAGNDPINGVDPLGLDGGGEIELAHGCGFWGDVKRDFLHAIFGGGGNLNCYHHKPPPFHPAANSPDGAHFGQGAQPNEAGIIQDVCKIASRNWLRIALCAIVANGPNDPSKGDVEPPIIAPDEWQKEQRKEDPEQTFPGATRFGSWSNNSVWEIINWIRDPQLPWGPLEVPSNAFPEVLPASGVIPIFSY